MSVRGKELRESIALVLDVLAGESEKFVFIGGCALGLYARAQGHALTATKDVDCITLMGLAEQSAFLEKLVAPGGPLVPDSELQCRYHLRDRGLMVDIMDLQGTTVGGLNRWFPRAASNAGRYELDDGRRVRAITPPFFLATKLVAMQDTTRTEDLLASKDTEDIVTLAVEVSDLLEQVTSAGIAAELAKEWQAALAVHNAASSDLSEIVDAHLGRDDAQHRERVIQTLRGLAGE